MRPIVVVVLGVCGAALVGGCDMVTGGITIARSGVSQAVIVVGEGAAPPERHAAGELAAFLREVTGATFPVCGGPGDGRPRLLVGPDAARLADPAFSTAGLGPDGIVLRTVGSDLILAGGRPRGTLYAVYTFLGDEVGCRWWSSSASTIPRRSVLRIAPLDVRYVPPLEYREPYWFDALDADWAVRNRCNGHAAPLDARRGGKHIYAGFVHTFYSLIPPEKHFEAHPEWFSEIDAKRTADRAQLCLTNDAMRRELVKNLKALLRANPAATIASVSQNDWHGNCQCDRCAAIDKEEGSPAGSLIRFVNAVAEDIEGEFPHVAVSTLAYQYTRKPPRHVRPRGNVIVRLCSIECSFSRPLVALWRNRKFRADLIGWSKMCRRLYIWDYTTNFRHYLLPHPNLAVLGPNLRFFVAHHVKGVFEQGAYQGGGAEMAELRAWMLARLLWDPTQRTDRLVREFTDGYYGPAGRHVRAYLKVTHDAVALSGDWLGCYSPPTAGFLSFKTLRAGWAHLAAAEAAVAGNPQLRRRVQVAQLPVRYAFLTRWDDMRRQARAGGAAWPMADSARAACDEFVRIAKANRIDRLSEGSTGFGPLREAVEKAGG